MRHILSTHNSPLFVLSRGMRACAGHFILFHLVYRAYLLRVNFVEHSNTDVLIRHYKYVYVYIISGL